MDVESVSSAVWSRKTVRVETARGSGEQRARLDLGRRRSVKMPLLSEIDVSSTSAMRSIPTR